MMTAGLRLRVVVLFLSSLMLGAVAHSRQKLQLQNLEIPLPGAPTVVLPVDLNKDGLHDLVVAVAYTEWDQIGIDELTEMRGVDGLVMVMTVVPVVMDRREIRLYLGKEGGGYREEVAILPIDLSVLSLDHGPEESPVILLTDTGVSALRYARKMPLKKKTFFPLMMRNVSTVVPVSNRAPDQPERWLTAR